MAGMTVLISIGLVFSTVTCTFGLPIVDPGLFVISGVSTCGGGEGYCLLGRDCTLDEDFSTDKMGGHCDGLKTAFTPTAHFVCCSDSNTSRVSLTTEAPKGSTILEDVATGPQDGGSPPQLLESSFIRRPPHCGNHSIIRLLDSGEPLCLAALIDVSWALTSASCASRLSRRGLSNVVAEIMDNSMNAVNLSAVFVHENYRSNIVDDILSPEFMNIGLIMLREEFSGDSLCLPSLPEIGQNFAGDLCNTIMTPPQKSNNYSVGLCETEVEVLPIGNRGEFLTMSCNNAWDFRYQVGESDIGKPLFCGNFLSGLETSSGIGMLVFTKIDEYLPWIQKNMKPIVNTFNTSTDVSDVDVTTSGDKLTDSDVENVTTMNTVVNSTEPQ